MWQSLERTVEGTANDYNAGYSRRGLARSGFDRMLGWFPNTRREWIEFLIATLILWLLMMVAVSELELIAVPDQWRLNLANNIFASA